MDQTQEQMKLMGTHSILLQTLKTIYKSNSKRLFIQITLTLIAPLAIIFIAHMNISNRFFTTIEQNPYQLITDACISYESYHNISNATSTGWRNYFIFKTITITTIIVFSTLSTATIVHIVVSMYNNRDLTYQNSMKVIPKVWKRLVVTFLLMFLTFSAYSLLSSVMFFLCHTIFGDKSIVNLVPLILYPYGFLNLSIVWQIAGVVSVMESSYGLKSMIKAMDLMKGKREVALYISLYSYLDLAAVVFSYMLFSLYDVGKLAQVWRVTIGIICWFLIAISFLDIMVTQTVFYMVCKSYHGENVEPLSLSTYLGAYLSDSQPVFRVGEDIQLGRAHNQPVSQA
ncbi:uncharacterized protein [Rutidosis leptorrhynchoides]|uniref:uncharacterized protein n=1 Tax=Rutidosis leptorrhynchoides TaxID=125765 RepID=UPI003A993FC4